METTYLTEYLCSSTMGKYNISLHSFITLHTSKYFYTVCIVKLGDMQNDTYERMTLDLCNVLKIIKNILPDKWDFPRVT